jgi:ribosomal protein L7/L12
MNISNLSQETLTKLVELAIASAPTKAAYIILEGIPVINIPTVVETVVVKPELSEYEKNRQQEIRQGFNNIVFFLDLIEPNRVAAIRELRIISGMGLKEAVNCIDMFRQFRKSVKFTSNEYWFRALIHFDRTGEVILNFVE